MRVLLAVWFFAHGLAHLPGFLVSWQLWSSPSLPFRTTLLGNRVDVGVVGIRLIGLGWLLAALAFEALAVAALLRIARWPEAAYVVLALSWVLSILGWPRSWIGVFSNVGAAGLLFASRRFGWL